MDSKNFRKVSNPNLYSSYKNVNPDIQEFALQLLTQDSYF